MVKNLSDMSAPFANDRVRRKRTKKAAVQEMVPDCSSKGTKEARRIDEPCILENLPFDFLSAEAEGKLRDLLLHEDEYHPKTEFLFRINSATEDKVNAALRDEAVFNLRFLHKFYNLSPLCFAHAVNIVDRFIVKVKVKPKYMACLATAAYHIATQMIEEQQDWPSPDKLVSVARCGGSANDLERMESIIRSKLQDCQQALESAVTPLHFLQELRTYFPTQKSFQRAVGDLEICLCSLAIYEYRSSQLALCVARRYFEGVESAAVLVTRLAELFELSEADLRSCDSAIDMESRRVQCRSPTPRALVWTLSRRTINCLQRPSAAAQASLDTITED